VPSLSPIAMVLYGAPVGLSHFSDTSRFVGGNKESTTALLIPHWEPPSLVPITGD
jgi:hypothetical protein